MVYVMLAEGFEEIEAVYPIDVLRRCEVEVKTVAVGGADGIFGKYVTGSNKITIKADVGIDDVLSDTAPIAMLILPGGPGRVNLLKSESAMSVIRKAAESGVPIAAICGAPEILDKLGLLKGKRFTCYPGLESGIDGDFVNEPVVADGNFITSQAAGTSEAFAFAIAEKLVGKSKADLIRGKMFCK